MIKHFSDQLGNPVAIPFPPRKIVSLVPSQTELLADLGLEHEVAGITKFCVHPPEWIKTKRIIGGTKNFRVHAIDEINPDLIIGNKEENYIEGIELLARKYPVWVSDVTTWKDSLSFIKNVGALTNKEKEANKIVDAIEDSFSSVVPLSKEFSVLYMIWKDPWMGAATHTFIDTMLSKTGFRNSLASFTRYPRLSAEKIRELSPDFIFLSSEPFPFKEKHISELKAMSPVSQVVLVDGEMFSWFGGRLVKAGPYLKGLLKRLSQNHKT